MAAGRHECERTTGVDARASHGVFSGIQLLMLGLVGEYLWRLYLMQKGKPQYVVRTKLTDRDH